MKAASVTFILAPTVLLPLLLHFPEGAVGFVLAWTWIICAIGCLLWGFFIFRRHRWMSQACLVAGFFHLALVVLLPLLMPAKTRARASAEPTRSSQQPPGSLVSAAGRGALLSGFVVASLPAAVAERERWASTPAA